MWTKKYCAYGKKDDVKYDQESEINTGNFKAHLQYRVNGGDTYLGDHLQNARRNATYISKTPQNELISFIGELIQRNIAKGCNTAGGFFFNICRRNT